MPTKIRWVKSRWWAEAIIPRIIVQSVLINRVDKIVIPCVVGIKGGGERPLSLLWDTGNPIRDTLSGAGLRRRYLVQEVLKLLERLLLLVIESRTCILNLVDGRLEQRKVQRVGSPTRRNDGLDP